MVTYRTQATGPLGVRVRVRVRVRLGFRVRVRVRVRIRVRVRDKPRDWTKCRLIRPSGSICQKTNTSG